jgi:hypothetical protein
MAECFTDPPPLYQVGAALSRCHLNAHVPTELPGVPQERPGVAEKMGS